MKLLPSVDKVVIPIEKLTAYSLNPDKDYNKATAFKLALGYDLTNADRLKENIFRNISMFESIGKGRNGFGEVYECVINLEGENGKRANILTSWIIEDGTDFPKLTNVYVTNKKVRKK